MKAITIKQPWATLISKGYKEYEFRKWKTKYRGEILIHAGKGLDKKAMKRFENLNLEYPTGCIIAKANIVDCVCVDEEFINKTIAKNPQVYRSLSENLEENKKDYIYGFKLENVEEISPIYINGKLSLWNYDERK
ncbi:MAG: ASCH domain-containing protein [Clostridia bacterium]|nr:ASCH domain-containing protein [Clostridia bacterium]MDD4375994.1 ASCH domain-containing protein [Clostridia bacterium]